MILLGGKLLNFRELATGIEVYNLQLPTGSSCYRF